VTAENVLDTSSYCNGHRRGNDSNCQVQQQGTHNKVEDASSRNYMIVLVGKVHPGVKLKKIYSYLGCISLERNLTW